MFGVIIEPFGRVGKMDTMTGAAENHYYLSLPQCEVEIVRERKALREGRPLLKQVDLLLHMVKGKRIIKLWSNVLHHLRRLLWVLLSASLHYRLFSSLFVPPKFTPCVSSTYFIPLRVLLERER